MDAQYESNKIQLEELIRKHEIFNTEYKKLENFSAEVAYKNVNNGFYDNNNQAKITEISNEIVIIENQIKQIINKQRRYLNDKKKALNVILNSHKNIDTNLYKQIKKDINFINNELCNYYNSYPFYTSKTSKTLNFFTIIITVIEIIVTTPRVWFTI